MEPITTAAAVTVAKLAAGAGEIKTASDLIEGVNKVKQELAPFQPDAKDLKIDYLGRSASLVVLVNVPVTMARSMKWIKIPTAGFHFKEVRNSIWEPVPDVLVREEGHLVVRASHLPSNDDKFFFILEGTMSSDALDHLVDANSSAAPADIGGNDVYWLSSAIRNPELLERIYHSVEIDRVNVSVLVALQRYFFTSLPDQVGRILRARDDLYRAAQTGNRNLRSKSEYTIRKSAKRSLITDKDLMNAIADLISQKTLGEHVSATEPFNVLKIDPDERRTSLIPERFAVQAGTSLNYSHKVSRGSLKFSREAYKKAVSERVAVLFPKSEPTA